MVFFGYCKRGGGEGFFFKPSPNYWFCAVGKTKYHRGRRAVLRVFHKEMSPESMCFIILKGVVGKKKVLKKEHSIWLT